MANWIDFRENFPASEQDIVLGLEGLFATGLGIFQYEAMAALSATEIQSLLQNVVATEDFVEELASWLNGRANGEGISSWTEFEESFEAADYPYISDLVSWYAGSETQFDSFQGLSTAAGAADLVSMGGSGNFWLSYASALLNQANDLSFDDFSDAFATADQAAVTGFLSFLQAENLIDNFGDLNSVAKGALVGKINGLSSSNSFIDRNAQIVITQMISVLATNPPDDTLESEFLFAVVAYYDQNEAIRPGIKALLESLITGGILNTLRDLAQMQSSALAGHIALLGTGSRYLHALAEWFLKKASQYTATRIEVAEVTRFEVAVRFSDVSTGEPASGFLVKSIDKRYTYAQNEIGAARTDARGLVRFAYEADLEFSTGDLDVQFEVYDLNDALFETTAVLSFDPATDSTMDVSITLPAAADTNMSISYLQTETGITISNDLTTYLSNESFTSLEDIRLAGGLARSSAPLVQNNLAEAQKLDSHAELELVSSDATLNEFLIQLGYTRLNKIANKSRVAFITEVTTATGSTYNQFDAARIWNASRQADSFQKTILMGHIGDLASGAQSRFAVDPELVGDLEAVFAAKCDCDACTSGVSPVAYLASLLDYAEKHITLNGNAVDPDTLQDLFYHPFCELPADCKSVTKNVCQVRVAVEVLRQHITSTVPYAKIRPYLDQAYALILSQIGTSLKELRTYAVSGGTSAEEEAALALRVGIDPANLSDLYMTNTGTIPVLDEALLDQIFGLRDTTRNPLSDGATMDDNGSNIYNWQLRNVYWMRNTDADGLVYVDIDDTVLPKTVKIYRDAAKAADDLVAEGNISVSQPYTAQLSPKDDRGISGRIEFKDNFSSATSIKFQAIPKLLAWRLASLREQWKAQEWPETNTYFTASRTLPIIEPDWMSPADIRGVLDSTTASSSQPLAARIWIHRRTWLDDTVISDLETDIATNLDAVFDTLETTLTYAWLGAGSTSVKPWDFSAVSFPFTYVSHTDLWNQIRSAMQNVSQRADALDVIQNYMHLDLAAYERLSEIQQKDNVDYTDEDKVDAVAIAANVIKGVFYTAWISEEDIQSITLTPDTFYLPVQETVEGDTDLGLSWEPFFASATTMPLIDPDVHSINDLSGPAFGNTAHAQRDIRLAELKTKEDAIFASRIGGDYLDMVDVAYTSLPTLPTGPFNPDFPSGFADFPEVLTGLNSIHASTVTGALEYVNLSLKLTEEEFREMMVVVTNEVALKPVSDAEYRTLSGILTKGWKRATKYADWVANYDNLWTNARPWMVYRHRMSVWSGTLEDRNRWTQGLAWYSRVPLVDPDMVVPGDIFNPEYNNNTSLDNPAYVLWRTREDLINNASTGWRTTIAAASVSANITAEIGTTTAELEELQQLREDGVDVSNRLVQLGLDPARLAFIVKMINAATPTDDELDAFYDIVVQVKKERQYGAWAIEERAEEIVIGPDMFVPAYQNHYEADVYLDEILKPWRSSRKARKAWDDRLESRIMQHEGMVNGHWGMVDSVESATLRTLRDILIMESGATGTDLGQKSRYLSDLLLTDMEIQCCQTTTRVAAGIETLQRMFHGLRTNILDEHPNLAIDDALEFDKDWKWLGSYGAWRGLMFVYLYPENLLLPSLRPNQTGTYKSILEQVRNNPRLTPSMVCGMLHQYEEYLSDISSLTLGATTGTTVNVRAGECGNVTIDPVPVTFMFAQGGETGSVYWSSFSENMPTALAQSFWEMVPGLSGVERIVDSFVYQTKGNDRFLYIFTVAKPDKNGTHKLVGNRMNLDTYRWQSDLEAMESEYNIWKWVIGKRKNEREAPIFATIAYRFESVVHEADGFRPSEEFGFDMYNYRIRYNWLDKSGLTWKQDDFEKVELEWLRDFELLEVLRVKNDAILFLTKVKNSHGNWELFPLIQYDDADKNPNRWFYPNGTAAIPNRPYGVDLTSMHGAGKVSLKQRLLLEKYLDGNSGQVPGYSTGKLLAFDPTGGTISSPVGFSRLAGIKYTGAIGNDDQFLLNYRDGSDNARAVNFTLVRNAATNTYTVVYNSSIAFDMFDRTKVGPCFQQIGTGATATYVPRSIVLQPESSNAIILVGGAVLQANMSLTIRNQIALAAGTQPTGQRGVEIGAMMQDNSTYALTTTLNLANPNLIYLDEAYYSLPVMLAEELQKNKFYTEALDLFRLVYDYRAKLSDRKVYPGLRLEENLSNLMGNAFAWLDDPENPHTIAAQRANSYTRYTIFALVRCFLDYADQEFTRDTAESVPRASMLYQTAMELLETEFFDGTDPACGEMLAELDVLVDDPAWRPVWNRMKARMEAVNNHDMIIDLINGWAGSAGYAGMAAQFPKTNLTWEYKIEALEDAFQEKLDERLSLPNRLCNIVNDYGVGGSLFIQATMGNDPGNRMMQSVSSGADSRFGVTMQHLNGGSTEYGGLTWLTDAATTNPGALVTSGGAEAYDAGQGGAIEELVNSFTINYLYQSGVIDRPFVPFSNYYFCVPRNPVPSMLLLHAKLNLHKIRNCRNIAGIRRSIEPYAAATDTSSGLPVIGAGGNISFPGAVSVPPTQYRYEALLSRSKELVSHAQQLEGTLLSILEKRDAEYYSVMRARQDAKVARAGVRLQDLRIREAEGRVDLAALTRDRSQLQVDGLQEMISAGLNRYETDIVRSYQVLEALRLASADISFNRSLVENAFNVASAVASADLASKPAIAFLGAASSVAAIGFSSSQRQLQGSSIRQESSISINNIYASFERRKQEWGFQQTLAQHDLLIGAQQIRLAQDRLRVVGQERQISQMQADHSQATLDFLINKFTNYELYDWMSRIMEGVYAFFLHQATGMAKMAQQQLAFERQEAPAALIQDDYWVPPSDNVSFGGNEGERVDRKGMTGSARLLQDVTRLDLHAFDTKQRKLQLTKTLSLAQLDPGIFAEFRRTGRMTFRTPMEIFDRDYPGHYLRLIQKVRTTVIALVPPIEGIKARLGTTGISRIVTGKDAFQTNVVARGSESVALSSPVNDSGMFELNYQVNEMLNPFEGMGVDAVWEFRMDQASNPFDFSTIADVLLTFEYTALESEDYRQEVIRRLDPDRQGELAFSFKYNFADQWYDLHNPDLTDTPYEVEIELSARDFPVNLSDVKTAQVSVLLVADDGTDVTPVQIELLKQDVSTNLPSYVGGIALPNVVGMASTRTGTTISSSNTLYTGNAAPWNSMLGTSPAGKWVLNLKPQIGQTVTTPQLTLDELLKEEKLQDIILIITYRGTEPQRS